MSVPAVVMGDRIVGICGIHQIPGPPTGNPIPAPPMPFNATLTMQLTSTVTIAGKPAAVVGSWGLNSPPHVGLHPADPYATPPTQQGRIVAGSSTVLIEGKPAAKTGGMCQMCGGVPGQLIGSAGTVLIGG